MSLRNRLFADGIYAFATRIVSMLLAAALGVLTARMLGTHQRGLYVTPMVDAGIMIAAFAGLSSATSYFLLRQNAGRGVARTALLAGAMFVLAAACGATILAFLSHTLWAAPAAILSLSGPAALMIGTGYATGTHRVRVAAAMGWANSGVILAIMVVAFAAGVRAAPGAIAAWLIATNLTAIGVLTWVALDARGLPEGKASLGTFTRYAARAGMVGIVTLLNYRADVYIVAMLGTPEMLGMYTLAVSAAEALLATTQVTALVTAPHVGSMEERPAAQLAARSVRHNVLISSICCAGLAAIAPFAVHLLYGRSFMPVVPAMRVLLIGVFALSLGGPMSSYFTIRLGRPEVPLTLASASAAICIVCSFLLIPRIGLVGAALASTAAYIAGQTAAIIWFASVARIDVRTMLIPRRSDLVAYCELTVALLARKGAWGRSAGS
ncbi:MAG TPA: polysaccharide biosynthesis C-terminal domain-containing protein [Candidatus Baltobacteraceae bacterium]|nr:polysaccharide biosynthesis C-terminal domain-containing protein [Candidatus Baltobacteraceae bacterium]